MTNDYIRREDALNAISCDITITGKENAEIVCKAIASFADRIKALPSADVAPVVHGRWIHMQNIYGVAYCSECSYELHAQNVNFCPNCGAKMDRG